MAGREPSLRSSAQMRRMGLPFDGERAEGRGAHVEFVIEVSVGVAPGGVVDGGAFRQFAGDAEDDGIAVAGIDLGAEDSGDGSAIGGVNREAAEAADGDEFAIHFGEENADDVAFEFGVRGTRAALVRAELLEIGVHIVRDLIGETKGETFEVGGSDVDRVVEGEIDGGDHADFGNSGLELALGFLDRVPFGLIGEAYVAADLDVVKRQIGLKEILTEAGDEFFKLLGEGGDDFGVGLRLALIPENATNAAAGGEESAIGGAVKRVA